MHNKLLTILFLKDLIVEAKHGVSEEEKSKTQRFKLNVEVTVDVGLASHSDDIKDTVDWSLLRRNVINTVQANSFNLMERLAREIAESVLEDSNIQKVGLSIEKLDAYENGTPGIKMELGRN